MAKLVNEIRTAFPDRDDIGVATLQKLSYLNACIEEGLRMYPPVPTGLPRVTPVGGAAVCGEWVPQNASKSSDLITVSRRLIEQRTQITVSVSHWSTYRSEKNFHKANQFIPERWLGEDEQFANDNHACFQPFSFGPRNCIGRNLAYHEARLLLTEVLWNFDLALDKKSDNWADQTVFTLWQKEPLWVTMKPAVH